MLLLQHPSASKQAASKSAMLDVKWLEVLAVRECPVQRYSETFGFGTEWQGFIVVVDFQLTFSFLVDEMEDC